MGERVVVKVDGSAWAAVQVLNALAAAKVDVSADPGGFGFDESTLFVALPDEAAKAPAKSASACERIDLAILWRDRAEKAEAALAAQAKRPSAGDRVRELDAGALASASTGGLRVSPSELGARTRAAEMFIPLIAAELDRQDAASVHPVEIIRDEHGDMTGLKYNRETETEADAPAPAVALPACYGLVTLVNGDSERYAEAIDSGRNGVAVVWQGFYHYFNCFYGHCVESTDGVMRGWRIHPDELPRFQAKAEPKPVPQNASGGRTLTAPDGTKIEVVHHQTRRHELESWTSKWTHGSIEHFGPCPGSFPMPWLHNPTDTKVLADYESWRAAQHPPVGKRVVVAADGARIVVLPPTTEWGTWAWKRIADGAWSQSLMRTEPTDAEVLADYAAWKAGQK